MDGGALGADGGVARLGVLNAVHCEVRTKLLVDASLRLVREHEAGGPDVSRERHGKGSHVRSDYMVMVMGMVMIMVMVRIGANLRELQYCSCAHHRRRGRPRERRPRSALNHAPPTRHSEGGIAPRRCHAGSPGTCRAARAQWQSRYSPRTGRRRRRCTCAWPGVRLRERAGRTRSKAAAASAPAATTSGAALGLADLRSRLLERLVDLGSGRVHGLRQRPRLHPTAKVIADGGHDLLAARARRRSDADHVDSHAPVLHLGEEAQAGPDLAQARPRAAHDQQARCGLVGLDLQRAQRSSEAEVAEALVQPLLQRLAQGDGRERPLAAARRRAQQRHHPALLVPDHGARAAPSPLASPSYRSSRGGGQGTRLPGRVTGASSGVTPPPPYRTRDAKEQKNAQRTHQQRKSLGPRGPSQP
mmetsp:Transcript_8661/g.25211  ORF Transcript_8661/g.25211 Transcript_8661/m.25211 type:complete len:417 (+) Transcript_8661:1414-2664(+)